MRLRVLGTVQVATGDGFVDAGPAKQSCVLAVLALAHGRPTPAETLIDRVWGDSPPRSTRDSLYQYVSRLRGLGLAVRRSGAGYRLDLPADEIDLHQSRALAVQARAAAAHGDPATAADLYQRALALWNGTPLAGIGGDWAAGTRDALVDEHLTLLGERFDVELALGHQARVLPELSAVVGAHPLVERFGAQLMLALFRSGRQAEALEHFAAFRRRMRDELGLEPGPALRDLHQQILRQNPALSAPPPDGVAGSPDPAVHRAPRQLPADIAAFAGRRTELTALDDLMRTGGARVPVVAAVSGSAGMGKTTLVVHWAHRVADRFPDGQLFVNLRGFDPGGRVMAAADVVTGLLHGLGVPPARIPREPDAQTGLYRSLLNGKRILVVLDNASDAEQVRPLLPGTPTAMVVVTSRMQLTGLVAIDGAHLLTLDPLTPGDARQLLAQRIGAQRVAAEPEAAERIIDACARLPLALAVAAARARHTGFPLAAVAGELARADQRLDVLQTGDLASEVRAAFASSYHAIDPRAARLFRLLSQHPGPDTSTLAAASLAGHPLPETRRLLAELTRASLLIEHRPGRYSFHDLLRAYAAEQVREDERRDAVQRLLDYYVHSAHAAARLLTPLRDEIILPLAPPAPDATPEHITDARAAMSWLAAEHQALLALLRYAAENGFAAAAWQLAWSLDTFLDRRGYWRDRSTAWLAAAGAAKRLDNPAAQAYAHCSLGLSETQLGRYETARAHLHRAFTGYTAVGDLAGQAHSHRVLSSVWEAEGGFTQALHHAREELRLFRAVGHRRWQAYALNAVGWYLTLTGDHAAALEHCEEALALFQELGETSGEAVTWSSLGHAQHHLGRYAEAVVSYLHSIDLLRDLDDRFDEGNTLCHLGDTYHAAGDHRAAARAWQRALQILTELDHPDVDAVREKLRMVTTDL